MSRDISKMFLYFLDLTEAETWLAWLVIHFEKFNFLEFILRLPANSLCFLLLGLRLGVTIDCILCLFIIFVRNHRLLLLKAR